MCGSQGFQRIKCWGQMGSVEAKASQERQEWYALLPGVVQDQCILGPDGVKSDDTWVQTSEVKSP